MFLRGAFDVAVDAGRQLAATVASSVEAEALTSAWCVLIVTTILLALTICFELAKDSFMESTPEFFLPMVNSLFGELTILGFISLVIFLMSQANIMPKLSMMVFSDAEALPELTENVHMILFLVMVLFLFEVGIILRVSISHAREWKRMEEEVAWCAETFVHDTKERLQEVQGRLAQRSCIRRLFDRWFENDEESRMLHALTYVSLREGFVDPREEKVWQERDKGGEYGAPRPHRVVDDKFDFAAYLVRNLGKMLGHVVHISSLNWALFIVFEYAFGAVAVVGIRNWTKTAGAVVAWCMIGTAYLMLLFMLYLQRKLNWIRGQLMIPKLAYDIYHDLPAVNNNVHRHKLAKYFPTEAIFGASPNGASAAKAKAAGYNVTPLSDLDKERERGAGGGKEGPAAHRVGGEIWKRVPPYLNRRAPKDPRATKHDGLFWMGAHGPWLILFLFRFFILFDAVYIALFIVGFRVPLFASLPDSLAVKALVVVVIIIPVFLIVSMMVPLASTYVFVECIEQRRVNETILVVVRETKLKKVLRILKLVNAMRLAGASEEDDHDHHHVHHGGHGHSHGEGKHVGHRHAHGHTNGGHGGKAGGKKRVERHEVETRQLIQETFKMVDTGGDGEIDSTELGTLLRSMGIKVSELQLEKMVREIDGTGVDGKSDGKITMDEFTDYMMENSILDEGEENPEELVEGIFDILDKNNDNFVSAQEFHDALRALGGAGGITDEDIHCIVADADEDGDGVINKDEFIEMVKKAQEM